MDTSTPNNKPDAEAKPAEPAAAKAKPIPSPAGSGEDASNKSSAGANGEVLKDDKSGYLYQPHAINTPDAKPGKAKKILKPKVLIPGSIIIILLIAGAVYLFLQEKDPTKKSLEKAGISLQNVNSDTLKNLASAIGLGQPKQTLTISADTIFKNQVTLEKGLTSDGLINAKAGIRISGAASADSLNIGSNLSVNGTTSLQGVVDVKNQLNVGGPINVTGSGSFSGNINVKGNASVGGNLSVSGTFAAGTVTVQTLTVSQSLTINGHIISGGPAPSISATSRIGSGGSASISGNDTAGTISIITGNSPNCGASGNGQWATVSFSRSFNSVPKVILSPVGFSSAKIEISAIRTPQNFTISCNLPPIANTSYAYDYIVVE
jgi:cytoskeletal protein CcmA (bactofilin family)